MVQNGGFSVKTTAYYAAEIILALEYLHTKAGIMHRDLKVCDQCTLA
jgi:serine/threonine protein kinase